MTTIKIANPLLCDPETGICIMPDTTPFSESVALNYPQNVSKKPIKIVYFTDPICSSCWGIEPQLRKMKLEYGDSIDVEYRMGGLLPDWSYNSGGISKPSDVAHHWDEVSLHYDMPIDGDVWLEDPLPSSYPPSIAFKAAQLQDEKRALLFLRRIREMVFLEKKNIAKWKNLEQAATEVGLNVVQLKRDFEGKAKQDFQNDLNLSKQLGVRGFPTLFFMDTLGNKMMLNGAKPYVQFEQIMATLLSNASKKIYEKTTESIFNHYPTLTTREYATLADIATVEADKLLKGLFKRKLLKQYATKNGVLWIGRSFRF